MNDFQQDTQGSRYLNFSLGTEDYAIPLLTVKEVIALPEITPIPFTPAYFLGIMNLRGQVISVIDLRQKFGVKVSQNTSTENAVIIIDLGTFCMGVVVDSINSVLSPKASDISDKPEIQSNKSTEYITNVFRNGKKLVLLIDITKTLSVEDHAAVAKAGAAKKAA